MSLSTITKNQSKTEETSFFAKYKVQLIIALISAVFYLPFLGGVHLFDWDEINFAEISREMVIMGEYLKVHVDYEPFWEKPPLFFWLQALSMHLFGIGEYAARFPNAICGIVTLVVLFNIGKKLKDQLFGILWAGAYFGSILPALYFKSGIIDPWFNLFILLGMYNLILAYWKQKEIDVLVLNRKPIYYAVLGGFYTGLAMLTKGPVAILIIGLCFGVYWIMQKFKLFISPKSVFTFILISCLTALSWFGIETIINGPWFVETFVKYQIRLFETKDAGHGGFFGYHFVVILIGCFPSSIFALKGMMQKNFSTFYEKDFKIWMNILLWTILILFTIVQSKIVHYSSMAYFPLTYLAALSVYEIVNKREHLTGWMKNMLYAIGGLIGFILFITPLAYMNIDKIKPLIKDKFTLANLNADVSVSGIESLSGIILIASIIICIYQINKQKELIGFGVLSIGTALTLQLGLIFYIAKAEKISQNAAVEFIKSLDHRNSYVVTKKYKSYAPFFYSEMIPEDRHEKYSRDWLHYGKDIDKDVYIITKIHKQEQFEKEITDAIRIGEKNGYVFYKREAN
ncbi:ArnT family glycosyltransferase [Aureibacter tunicatorum]|uniref:4-amino-4-deoxy-L-arabinose transferase-like glycosyltransferase n=1 Tax=Aureibacter tunicatorum TaxID=866807 RepID=A0AAE3XPI4_9BACT|nr:glycosyltransferase family 39 protein [Aureibacter tunicatorum]MDR6239738.1 4-amino-4-deoxy-L-arabinose transferase-like glycosyltransferase [Aureibacter tunicatorum]BDD04214.1 hypothetical protein AUTU_16970 [Aureibacter tunicatorum]